MRRTHWRWIARLLLLGLSVAAMGVVFELGLRAAGYEAIYAVYSKPSILWRKDPLLGWSHQPDSSGLYVGPRPWPIEFETPVRINTLGLRGSEVLALPPGGRRVLFLGDSLVAGFEVHEQETFVQRSGELLQEALGIPVQTINGGVRGYGTDQSLLYFRSRGHTLQPDLVVFIHSLNDPRNNMTLHRQRRPFGKPAFALGTGARTDELELVGSPVPDYPLCAQVGLDENFRVTREDGAVSRSLCGFETRLADHSALFTFVTLRLRQNPQLLHWLRSFGVQEAYGAAFPRPAAAARLAASLLGVGTAHAAPPWEGMKPRYALTSRLLRELAREVRASGAKLMILIRRSDLEQMDPAAIYAEGARFRQLVITDEMTRGRPIRFENDAHFNVLGHELAARLIAPELAEILGTE